MASESKPGRKTRAGSSGKKTAAQTLRGMSSRGSKGTKTSSKRTTRKAAVPSKAKERTLQPSAESAVPAQRLTVKLTLDALHRETGINGGGDAEDDVVAYRNDPAGATTKQFARVGVTVRPTPLDRRGAVSAA